MPVKLTLCRVLWEMTVHLNVPPDVEMFSLVQDGHSLLHHHKPVLQLAVRCRTLHHGAETVCVRTCDQLAVSESNRKSTKG